ncbi:hypothetical protein Tco_0466042 [Tanacetum coccineum]
MKQIRSIDSWPLDSRTNRFAHLSKQVLVKELKEKSINEKEVLAIVEEEGHTWMTPIYEYIVEEIIPEEKEKSKGCVQQGKELNIVSPVVKLALLPLIPWVLFTVSPLDESQILSNPEVTGRLLKWSFELEEHDIHYRLRASVKGQILADVIVERPEDDSSDTPMEDKEELSDP